MRKSRGHLFIHSECHRVISDRRVEEDSMCLTPQKAEAEWKKQKTTIPRKILLTNTLHSS